MLTLLFRPIRPQKLNNRRAEFWSGERRHMVRAFDDFDLAMAEQFLDGRHSFLGALGFLPSVDEEDRSLTLLQILAGYFQLVETETGEGKGFHILAIV